MIASPGAGSRAPLAERARARDPLRVGIIGHRACDPERRRCGLVVAQGSGDDELLELAAGADATLTNWRRVPGGGARCRERAAWWSRATASVSTTSRSNRATGTRHDRRQRAGLLHRRGVRSRSWRSCSRARAASSAFACSTRAGSWDLLGLGRGLPRLRGQRLGIVGFGHTARALIPKAQGFGLEVMVLDSASRARVRRRHRRRDDRRPRATCSLVSDYVSLHAPATPATRGLIGEAQAAPDEEHGLPREHLARLPDRRGCAARGAPGMAGSPARRSTSWPRSRRAPAIPCSGSAMRSSRRTRPSIRPPAIAELQTKAARNVASVLRGEVPATIVNPGVLELPRLPARRPPVTPQHSAERRT